MKSHTNDNSSATVILKPLRHAVDFSLAIPGSKSIANRALLLAAVATGVSRLSAIPKSKDISAALSALQCLGVETMNNRDILEVAGVGLAFPNRSGDVEIGSSGTVGRFLPGLLAAAPSGDWRLLSSDQLAKRPLTPLLDALGQLGADVARELPDRSFPLRVAGGGLRGGTVEISAAGSSQFASGVLMAAPFSLQPIEVLIRDVDPDEAYINLTLDLMRAFGVASDSRFQDGIQRVRIDAPQAYRAVDLAIEADFNSALYFLCLPLLVGGSATVTNLSCRSGQPGLKFLDILARMGGTVYADDSRITVNGGVSPLRGGFEVDMRAMSEMALTLGVMAVFADVPVTMTNLAHIRGHETDRLAVLADSLRQVGGGCEEGSDWIRIHPAAKQDLRAVALDSRDDHRLAMSFSLFGLAANGLVIHDARAVDKTFPEFFSLLSSIGAELEYRL